ncbi:Sacsin [Geodia barretti]|uniref:Sacsin n=1 Tax=Geodia barretti TaxID=519541 RepID=A0AA35TQ40_GEOBA|nr:Sacsin [Geodia barretti]
MNIFSPEGIVGAIQAASPSYHSISFTRDEAAELIMQVHNTRGLNYQQQAILKEIPMFTTLQNKLSSVAQVERSTGRGAQIEPPSFPLSTENLPKSVVLFSGDKYVKILKLCGLKTFVSKQEIVDIISSIGYPGSNDPVRADEARRTRAKAVLTYIKRWEHQLNENVYIVAHSLHHHQRSLQFSQALRELSVTKCWLPVQLSPPRNYPSCLTWKGSGCDSHFVSFGSSVLLHKEQTSLALACGSQMYLVEHSLPNAICKAFEPAPEDMVRHIMAHLETVILSCEQFGKTEEIRSVMHTIYVWLTNYSSEGHAADLSQLKETQHCVWLTRQRKFVHPQNVALAQNPEFRHNLEPFVYILPDDLAQFECLFKDLGVQEMVTREQILGILPAIKEGDSHSLGISSEQAWQLVMAILHWLTESEEGEIFDIDLEDLLVPVQSDETWPQLVAGEGVVYADNNFLQDYLNNSEDNEVDFTFVHGRVNPQMAYQLQLTPLSQHLNISEDAFEDVGQSEPLTVRLRNILKDYKDGLTIIKELLQNADDAGATEMNICYDKRCHTDRRRGLFFPGMVECHGPALVVNNNAMFTEEDFVNITKLAGATKEAQSLKIGKFGIGFCSVYHITDVPSFVSSDLLYIFDPTLKYLKNEIKNPARPGKKLCFTSRFISRSKQLEPYVGLFDFDPAVQYEGTTFRFPFRTTVSELSEKIYTDHDIKQLMEQMQKSNSKLLLFLQNIDSITFSQLFELDENVIPLQSFCSKKLVDKAMKELGVLHDHIPLEHLEERAAGIAEIYHTDTCSQAAFLNQSNPSEGGCGFVNDRVKDILQVRNGNIRADRICRKTYAFFETTLRDSPGEIDLSELMEKPCIWTEREFIKRSAVARDWKHDGPYLFKIPTCMDTRRKLQEALQIKGKFSTEDLVSALQCLKRDFGEEPIPENCQKLVQSILGEMPSENITFDFRPIVLPDTDFIMREASELYYNDMPWKAQDKDYVYVHERVPLVLAKALGVQLCRAASLARYAVLGSSFSVAQFGQHEELTRRIQNIIRDYPFDMTILKELLQNADDAKASKMYVILDMREHRKEHVLSEKWGDLQGPALLVWNDSVFSEEDLKGIQCLGLGSKRSDSETIGQYGIGFNAVYHLTDCPSFLTGGNTLCILDPHMKYVPQATDRHPGAMYGNLDKKFWDSFDGLKSAYLLEKVKKKPEEMVGGTLFRFPLRYNKKLVKSSDIVRELKENLDDLVLTGGKLHGLLLKWAPSMKKSLLFLNNVTELRFFVVRGRGVLELENTYRAELGEIAMENRKELTANLKTFATQEPTRPFVTCYPLTVVESAKGRERKEQWLVQQGIGDIQEGVKTWKYVEQVKPRHGLAAPLSRRREEPFVGNVFCFLPLPLSSKLPVHINGHFILNSTRRNLWTATDDRGDDKSRWNENILQAIASSYAKFLELIPEYFPNIKGCNRRDSLVKSLRDYYLCFPNTSGQEPLSEPWLTLVQQVYKVMSACNSPVLAVPTKKSLRSSEDEYFLQWRPLKSDQMPESQVHFWRNVAHKESENDKIKSILERIGMKITYAPLWILDHFQKAELKIPSVSPESVYNFYSLFNQAFIADNYPVQIEETPFQCVGDFKSFTDFLLDEGDEEQCTFPKEPFGQPLLLNADNQLCIFDQANKILCSEYTNLFPQSPNRFLHEELIECSYSQSYFLSVVDPERVEIVKELIETILPAKLKNRYVSAEDEEVNMAVVKLLWECFSHDEVFKSVLAEVLKVWALLLTKDRRLFRCESDDQLLPIALQANTDMPYP